MHCLELISRPWLGIRIVLLSGTALALSFSLLLFSSDLQAQTVDICDRTDQIETVILAKLPAGTNCASVDSSRLANITEIDASNESILSLNAGDFSGLAGLKTLKLRNNYLTSLPEDLFQGLTNLEKLSLGWNRLSSLDKDLFDGLTSLDDLALSHNNLNSLHEDLFDGLTSLESLDLRNNSLPSLAENLFDGLTSLEYLALGENPLTNLHENLFDGLKSLEVLGLVSNSLSSLHEDQFDGLTNLTWLNLFGNSLSSLHKDLVNDLTKLGTLWLSYNNLTSLPENLFDHVKTPQALSVPIEGNDIPCFPTAIVSNPAVTLIFGKPVKICGGTATLSLSPTSISENSGSTMITATLDRLASSDIKIMISTAPQAPALVSDYMQSLNDVLTIAAGKMKSTGIVTITANDNDVDAPNKTIMVQGMATSTEHIFGPEDVTLTITDDDATPVATLILSPSSIRENGESATVTATLDRPSSEVTTISVSADPQTPAPSSDFRLSQNATLTIAAGQTTSTGSVTITANDNVVDAPDKAVTIRGMATNTQGITQPADVTLTITDDDMASLTAPASMVVPEGNSGSLPVVLSTQPTGDVTVTVIGHVNTDLTPTPLALTFTPSDWNAEQVVMLTASEDDDFMNDQVALTLTASGGGYASVTHSVAVTITDDDVASMTVPASVAVPEGSSSNLPMVLSAQPTGDVTLTITGHATTDLTPTPLQLTFTTTDWNTPQMVTLAAREDDDFVNDQVVLTLTTSGGGYTGVTHSVAITITDDDTASLTAPTAVAVTEGSSGNLPVKLTSQPTADVTVTITGHAPTDLTPIPLTLTFTPTTWSTPQMVTLRAAEDGDFTNDQVTLTLTASGGGYAGAAHSVTVIIADNDVTAVTAPASAVVPEGHSSSLSVALSLPPIGDVTVTVTGHATTDLNPAPSTLTFTPTDWNTPQPVTLTASEDGDFMNDLVTLTLTASGGGYAGVTHLVAVTIIDNDVASVMTPAFLVVPEGHSSDLSVALSLPPTADVMVTVTGHMNTDLIPSPRTLTFTTTNWNAPRTMTLTAAQDRDLTNDLVALTLVASGGGYTGMTHSVSVTIVDDDIAAVTAPASVLVPEGGSSDLPVSLSAQPTGNVTVTITGYEATDLTPNPATLVFTTTNWSVLQTVTLTAAEDGDVTDDPIALTLTASGGGYTDVTHSLAVTITDGDVPSVDALASVTVPEGGSRGLPVALSAPPTTEVTLTIAGHAGTDLTPTPSVLIFTPTDWNVSQTVTLAAAEDGDVTDDQVMLTFTASGGGYTGVTHSVTVTITDNEVGAVTAPTSVVVPEGGSRDLPVALSSPPTAEVTLTIAGHSGTDLTPTPSVLIFAPTDWNVSQMVTLAAAEDGDVTDDQVMLTFTASGGGYTGVTHSVAVTITDNEVGAVTAPTSVVVPEGGSRGLPVVLSAPPTAEVTLTITGHAATDLTPTPPVLIFTPTDWATVQTVTLAAAEDLDFDDDQVMLTLTASDGGYTGVTHLVTVTITDNDVATVTAPASVIIPEGSTTDLPVALLSPTTAHVTLTITGHAGTDLTPVPRVLTFTTANWNVTQTVVLTAAEDEDFTDDPVTLTLTASGGGYAGVTHSVAVTITDNDTEAPLSLSIYDLQILENAKTGQLRVELNRPSDQVVTVQYATSDKTAEKGSDYTASRGIVVFDRHTTKGVIPVGILDDTIPEVEEQLTVTLSKPRNAVIDRGVGTLTIVDNDGELTLRIEDEVVEAAEGVIEFTVRLSRPGSESVTVAYRTEDGTAKAGEDYHASSGVVEFAPGSVAATIAVPLLLKNLDWQQFSVHLERSTHARIAKAVAVATIRKADSAARDMLAAYTARFVRTLSVQIVEALQERFRTHTDGSACGAGARAELARLWHAPSDWTPSLGELLAGCHISEGMMGGAVRVWGRGAFRQFHGQENLRGEVATGLAGVDYGWNGKWVAGLLLAHSRGEGTYQVNQDTGTLASRLTGMYPYVAYQNQERGIWGTGGYGRGRAEALELEGNLGSGFGALGFWGRLGSTHPVQLTYYGDGIYADAVVKRQDVDAQVYRLRLGLEAGVQIREGVRPYVRANVRQDGGNAETGLGLELGGGVRVAVPAWRLKGDVQTQGLVVHTAKGFTEWGISGSVQFGARTQGLMLRVRPSWGPSQGMSLAHQQAVLDVVPAGRSLYRTEMELGYGVAMKQGTARSVLGTTWQSGGALLRLGGELRPQDRFTLSAFGLVHAHAATRGELGLNVRGSIQY